jgi:hypothetical protein
VSSNLPLLDKLQNNFTLDDGEYLIGDWASGVEFIYLFEGKRNFPLVTRREVGKGLVYWINSGDHTEKGPAKSLSRPDTHLVKLVSNLISFQSK